MTDNTSNINKTADTPRTRYEVRKRFNTIHANDFSLEMNNKDLQLRMVYALDSSS